MRELAQTFFSLHRTPKRDDAQKRLSVLRRKLVSEQTLRRELMGMFRETYGHLGDYSEQHQHARHRLMSLNWQLTSLESDLPRALRNGRSHEVRRLAQLPGGSSIGVRKRLFFHLPISRPDKEEMKTHVQCPARWEEWTLKWSTMEKRSENSRRTSRPLSRWT